ncbi:hypothetical protein ACUNV4_24650 [Granulosicoccus sp. 3-233]|uniref:hypothetical protein n=1 Tax=Granulosicoccus sp. 3-233 TaxID=3417969 RepID=UPI003D34A1C1
MKSVSALPPSRMTRFSAVVLLSVLLCLGPANAFDQLSQAQSLIYDTSHLANTHEGQQIDYRYESIDTGDARLQDKTTLTVSKTLPEDRRDVEVNFLSAERHMALPPFQGYRGNPVIIAMLEHIAQSMGSDTGGGALYFRNRIRDALADAELTVEESEASYAGSQLNTRKLTFRPFMNDTFLGGDSSFYRNTEFSIRFSDQVPAGVLAITVHAESDEALFHRQLSLE